MSLSRITEGVSRWIDMVAAVIVDATARFRPVRRTQFIEEDGGTFSVRGEGADVKIGPDVESVRLLDGDRPAVLNPALSGMLHGREIEIVLRPSHFLVRPLELPRRAGEFLEGIVRSQIDRLTPWSAADAAFGWTQPVDAPDDRISLTVVATAWARIEPYVQALVGLGASSVAVSMLAEGGAGGPAPVRVFARGPQGPLGVARIRHGLMIVLAAASVTAAVAATTAQIVGDNVEAQMRDVSLRIAARRAALINGRNAAGGAATAQHALVRRKHETAASVMVLETLSQVLPDHTYMTELRVEGDKLQIVGATQEAPSLIRLMEGSPYFSRATFFAPTTRSPADLGERFHIEARIKPVFPVNQ